MFHPEDVVVVSSPVYGGKIAPIAKQRMEGINGNGAKCVIVAVYGNRAFENAVADFSDFMTAHGFRVCGAAAFVGEHSYSTPSTPIAHGRPDAQDIADAHRLGNEIGSRISSGEFNLVDAASLEDEHTPETSITNFRDFIMKYRQQQARLPEVYLPEVDLSLCDDCGSCHDACPTEAISSESHAADPDRCIKCCACVKICPQNARKLHTPFAKILSENFNIRKSPRWLL